MHFHKSYTKNNCNNHNRNCKPKAPIIHGLLNIETDRELLLKKAYFSREGKLVKLCENAENCDCVTSAVFLQSDANKKRQLGKLANSV